ncbi:migration and invasion-inhibitory protein [Ctenopharyngodon idella]|uniref:migration and invasion-inhibitory protein n=1 Tax=Ctenopharyngodon idella TaxID=7959 RepID=UPI0022308B9A|nr:migration and invasion-inhibitory protein [Ctenopharyngodon idella]
MAELKQIDALRKQNKDLLKKLKKQTEKLHQLTPSWPDEKDKSQRSEYEAFTVESVFLTERNGAQSPRVGRPSMARASPSSPTAVKTINISDEQLSEHCEDSTPDQHKPKHKQSSEVTKYSTLLQDTDNSRWKGRSRSVRLMLPKSAPLTADSDQRETDSATTAGLEETVSERHIQPLLGYDWIAGLLDAESSLADRSEQFFSELHSFRQVNRDECVHNLLYGLPSVADLASFTLGEEPQPHADTHQCTFCYRINSRLFAVPLDTQAACPVCKMPKSEHPHTETEPALIRVSIPRSTLLPAHQYKAHRRCSFDSSDSLSLPSHCLSGWSNPTLNSGSQMSSLDLRGSMTKPAATRGSFSSWFDNKLDSSPTNASRQRHSDQLQNVSRLPRYAFQHLDTKRPEPHSCSYTLY